MRNIKLMFEMLAIAFCITLSSCNGKVSETEGSSGSNGDPRKETDKIMSACNYVYGTSSTDNQYYKRAAEKLDMNDMIEAGYKCPSSAVPNIDNKLGSNKWYKPEKVAASDSMTCKELSSRNANTLMQYGAYKDGRIRITIHDCANYQCYDHTFEKGEL